MILHYAERRRSLGSRHSFSSRRVVYRSDRIVNIIDLIDLRYETYIIDLRYKTYIIDLRYTSYVIDLRYRTYIIDKIL